MRAYWDARARENAAYYVDTTVDYESPDMEQFFETGRTIVDVALVQAPVQPERRHLAVEIGSGLGRICAALRPHFDQVVGIDISPEMVRQAAELVDDDGVRFVLGDGVTLPVDDDSADLVTSFTVLQHLPELDLIGNYLREASRVVRSGGVLALQWNNDAHPRRYQLRSLWWRLQRRLGLRHRDDERVAPQFLGTPASLDYVRSTLESAGLQVVGTRGEGTLFAWVWARKP
jgi:ubiquinone/menaquinone biosynthesis C-methylase UbiE